LSEGHAATDDEALPGPEPDSTSAFRGGAPVVVEYVHDEEIAAAGLTVHVIHGEPAWRKWFLRVAGLYLIGVGVYCFTLVDQEPWLAAVGLAFLAGALLAFKGRKRIMLWRARRHHRGRPDGDRPLRVRLHDGGIDMHVEELADATFSWRHVSKAVLADTALLLYITAEEYIHLPRALIDADGLTRIVDAVHDHVPDIRVTDETLERAA
jgi:LPXTG-motif cell wall-anchored protein